MNPYGHNPNYVPPAKEPLARPGRHEVLTLIALFLSGSCMIASLVTPYTIVGAVVLMCLGLVGLWSSRSWSASTKGVATCLLLLLYVALAVIAAIALKFGVEPPAAGVLLRLAVLGMVFGVPAGIAAWFALLFQAVRGRVERRPAAAA